MQYGAGHMDKQWCLRGERNTRPSLESQPGRPWTIEQTSLSKSRVTEPPRHSPTMAGALYLMGKQSLRQSQHCVQLRVDLIEHLWFESASCAANPP